MNLRPFILRALRAAAGQPITDPAIRAAAREVHGQAATTTAITAALRDLEDTGLVASVNDPVTGLTHYTLTITGQLHAARL